MSHCHPVCLTSAFPFSRANASYLIVVEVCTSLSLPPPSLGQMMKRKIAEQAAAAVAPPPPKKKRSPLLGKPQKQYDAPDDMKSNMTKEQLAEWRKQLRKERNRASAAASRQKTQGRINELEGEVTKYKNLYEDMQDKMLNLQRQVDLLTKVHCQANPAATNQDGSASQHNYHNMVSPPSSHPNPTSSLEQINALTLLQGLSRPQLVLSSDATLLLPPQSSSTQDQTTVENKVLSNVDDSKKHLNTISRQA